MIYWNAEGFKVGHCYQPPLSQEYSVLTLSNNTSIKGVFENYSRKFHKLYDRGLYKHHYLNFMEEDVFGEAIENCRNMIASYDEME